MFLEIITPESKIFSGNADAVQLPGKDGLFQLLDHHAPMISTLAEGRVKVDLPDSAKKIDGLSGRIENDKSNDRVIYMSITGGVVEVQNNKVILLAE